MEWVIAGLHWKVLLVYMDDVIMFIKTFEDHLDRMRKVLRRNREAGLKLKPNNTQNIQRRSETPWSNGKQTGVSTSPDKVKYVEFKRFLGLIRYYWRYVPDFATIVRPPNRLTSPENAFIWQKKTKKAIQKLKTAWKETPTSGYQDVNCE